MDGVEARRPYSIEYRIAHRDGSVHWVLERGQAAEAGDGRRWLDGAIFDITARRAAEDALRQHEVMEAQLAEVRASRARILDAADRARREIERNLHDGAQQRFVSVALRLQLWLTQHRDLPPDARGGVAEMLDELRDGLADLRDLAHGLHPAILSDRGLNEAVLALTARTAVPVEVEIALNGDRPGPAVESAAYFTVCEALTNVDKYANATQAWVRVHRQGHTLRLEIGDDGVGGVDDRRGSGLQGLRDRVAAVGGTLEVASPLAAGTVVRACLPFAEVR
jgi:signal transduction histidine kinase